jgi:nitrous oxidase accessory protein
MRCWKFFRRTSPVGLLLLVSLLVAWSPASAEGNASTAVQVCPTCANRTIEAAIAAAEPGDTILVRGGVYQGPLIVTKSVKLQGVDWPVVDGGNRGTVVRITAPDTTLQGFVVRNGGTSYDREDSGISVEAARGQVIGNRFENDLFGVYLRNAPDSLVQGNSIVGKPLPEPLRGDAIKVWYSPRAQIVGNDVKDARDCLIWFSDHSIIRDNVVSGGRYGFHFMYGNGSLIEHNRLENNSVGIYLMYGRNMTVRSNLLFGSRGPSGDGLGLKEIDGVEVDNNVVVDNRVGIYVDNSPLSSGIYNHYRGNVVAYNDEGLALLPVDRNNVFTRNSLIDNVQQVAVLGGGRLGDNQWEVDGAGNFWSDYVGYDANGDGVGDVPYQPRQFSEQLMDTWPVLQLFRFSIAAGAVDFAARSFPIFASQPVLIDSAPLTSPIFPAGTPLPERAAPWPSRMLAVGLLVATGLVLKWSRATKESPAVSVIKAGTLEGSRQDAVIEVQNLTKRYSDKLAIHNVSFTVPPGQSIALWGPNGAGKTTILRCLLGQTRYDGRITIAGLSPASDGKEIRALIGYVPQEPLTFDLTVSELCALIAGLRGVPRSQIVPHLERFGLADTLSQPVTTLSGGMKQKLALALALFGDPPILLLDEPTANLDSKSHGELLGLLLSLKRQGRNLVFTSHRWAEVKALADQVVLLEHGEQIGVKQPSTTDLSEGPELTLRVLLGPNDLQQAHDLLVGHGFATRRNGTSVAVKVPTHRKADPLILLSQSGYPVVDFDLEGDQ